MQFTSKSAAREHAAALVVALRAAHLNHLAGALEDALAIDVESDEQSAIANTQEATAASVETHNQLLYWYRKCAGTLDDIKASPVTRSDGKVHAFGNSWTPSQADAIAQSIAHHAYYATRTFP